MMRSDCGTRKERNVFMAKWIAEEKARVGLRHAAGMPERDGKDQEEDSPKQVVGSCWFARHS